VRSSIGVERTDDCPGNRRPRTRVHLGPNLAVETGDVLQGDRALGVYPSGQPCPIPANRLMVDNTSTAVAGAVFDLP
jgi:hypothetical protein